MCNLKIIHLQHFRLTAYRVSVMTRRVQNDSWRSRKGNSHLHTCWPCLPLWLTDRPRCADIISPTGCSSTPKPVLFIWTWTFSFGNLLLETLWQSNPKPSCSPTSHLLWILSLTCSRDHKWLDHHLLLCKGTKQKITASIGPVCAGSPGKQTTHLLLLEVLGISYYIFQGST